MEELNSRKVSFVTEQLFHSVSRLELTNDWIKLNTRSPKFLDGCIITFSARMNERRELELRISKSISRPAEAKICVTCENPPFHKKTKRISWIDDCIFVGMFLPASVQWWTAAVCIFWYGFLDEKLIPPPMTRRMPICPGTKHFYLNDFLSDFKIIIGDEVFPVHKFHLAAESDAFLKMFETSMKESRENSVVIEDIEAPVMKEVLKYIYTRETDSLNDVDMSMNVLVAAEKYGLDELKGVCGTTLSKNLNIDNALIMLDFADMHNAEQLRKSTIDFLTTNRKEIAQRADFKEFYHKKPELLFDFITMAFEK